MENSTSITDQIPALGEYIDGVLHIYVTKALFEGPLSQHPSILAELIDHEYAENVLKQSHRDAATRARYFARKNANGDFESLSQYHEWILSQIKDAAFLTRLSQEDRPWVTDENQKVYESLFRSKLHEIIFSETGLKNPGQLFEPEFLGGAFLAKLTEMNNNKPLYSINIHGEVKRGERLNTDAAVKLGLADRINHIKNNDYVYVTVIDKMTYRTGGTGYRYRIMVATRQVIEDMSLWDTTLPVNIRRDVSDKEAGILFFREFSTSEMDGERIVDLENIAASGKIKGQGLVSGFYSNFAKLLVDNFAGLKVEANFVHRNALLFFIDSYEKVIPNGKDALEELELKGIVSVSGRIPRHMKALPPSVPAIQEIVGPGLIGKMKPVSIAKNEVARELTITAMDLDETPLSKPQEITVGYRELTEERRGRIQRMIDQYKLRNINDPAVNEIIQNILDHLKSSSGNIYLIDYNELIQGYGDKDHILINEELFNEIFDPKTQDAAFALLFHEAGHSYFSTHADQIPEGLNAHTYLRGLGYLAKFGLREDTYVEALLGEGGLGLQDMLFGDANYSATLLIKDLKIKHQVKDIIDAARLLKDKGLGMGEIEASIKIMLYKMICAALGIDPSNPKDTPHTPDYNTRKPLWELLILNDKSSEDSINGHAISLRSAVITYSNKSLVYYCDDLLDKAKTALDNIAKDAAEDDVTKLVRDVVEEYKNKIGIVVNLLSGHSEARSVAEIGAIPEGGTPHAPVTFHSQSYEDELAAKMNLLREIAEKLAVLTPPVAVSIVPKISKEETAGILAELEGLGITSVGLQAIDFKGPDPINQFVQEKINAMPEKNSHKDGALAEKIKNLLNKLISQSNEFTVTVRVLDEGDSQQHSVYVITLDGEKYILNEGDEGLFSANVPFLGPVSLVSVDIKRSTAAEQAEAKDLMEVVRPILENKPLNRAALVEAMKQRAGTPEDILRIISEVANNPELEMALRTAVLVNGLSDIPKNGHTDIVAQLVPTGARSKALSPIQKIIGKLSEYPYKLYAKSIIEEGVDEASLKKLIDRINEALTKDPTSKAVLMLPVSFEGKLPDGLDSRIRIQYIDYQINEDELGVSPDIVSQFGLGFLMLEYDRLSSDEKNDKSKYLKLVNMLASMADINMEEFNENPVAAIQAIFKGVLKIRRINWNNVDEQRRAWEAVATAL